MIYMYYLFIYLFCNYTLSHVFCAWHCVCCRAQSASLISSLLKVSLTFAIKKTCLLLFVMQLDTKAIYSDDLRVWGANKCSLRGSASGSSNRRGSLDERTLWHSKSTFVLSCPCCTTLSSHSRCALNKSI